MAPSTAGLPRQDEGNEQRQYVPPPDGGFGWVMTGACFTLNASTWGITSSFGVYLSEYILSGRFQHSSAFELGFVGGLNFSCAMLVAPLVTHLTRRLGLHPVMVSGCLLQAIGYLTAPLASRLWHLYLTQGALVGVGIGCIVIPSTAVLSQWFSSRRSIANGISSAGSGIGGAAFTWGTAAAIRHVGVDWTLRITGLVALGTTLAATFVVRDRNAHVQPSQLAFDVSLLRRPEVVLLLLWVFVSMFGYVALLFSLSDFAIAIDLSREQATDVVGLLNIGTAVGRPLIGAVSDRYSRTATAGVLTLACGVLCFAIWVPASSFAATAAFAVPCGAIVGVFWMTIGPLAAEIASLKHLQSVLSLAWMTTVVPTACGEPIALLLRTVPAAPRPYLFAQTFAGLSYTLASTFMFALWRRLGKPRQSDRGADAVELA